MYDARTDVKVPAIGEVNIANRIACCPCKILLFVVGGFARQKFSRFDIFYDVHIGGVKGIVNRCTSDLKRVAIVVSSINY